MKLTTIVASAGLLILAGICILIQKDSTTKLVLRRRLEAVDAVEPYKLPPAAQKWCQPSRLNPLNFHACNPDDTVMEIPFVAGLTNGLKFMLLMVIDAYQQNRCFYITEKHNHLLMRDDKTQELDTFIGRYFEPIGLSESDPIVVNARKEGRIQRSDFLSLWGNLEKRRVHGIHHDIPSLSYKNIESTHLKKVMLERMWRLLPGVRNVTCSALESHGIEEEYLAYSVRRGDKDTEGFEFTKPEDYITATEAVVKTHFDGKVPKIFVATDDCAVMAELRKLRPTWAFTSECDRSEGHSGFVLKKMRSWNLEQTDEHFRKFFVELLGLAGAKFYIGVSYTNVAWWASYMRLHRWSHLFLDERRSIYDTLNIW